jgi:hypothetical protein
MPRLILADKANHDTSEVNGANEADAVNKAADVTEADGVNKVVAINEAILDDAANEAIIV